MRNPIAAIKMAVEMIRNDAKDSVLFAEMTDLIERNADQAGELINQLLDAHLIKSGAKLSLEIEHCDILAILTKCKQSLAPQDRIKVQLHNSDGEQMWGYWEPLALERIFKNLLSNALKFGDTDREILLVARQGQDITNISVQNYGQVITLENQLKIFSSQFRVENKDFKSTKGWGLGLTLVKGLAEAHNGKIDVTSSLSEGTCFTLRLPNDCRR